MLLLSFRMLSENKKELIKMEITRIKEDIITLIINVFN